MVNYFCGFRVCYHSRVISICKFIQCCNFMLVGSRGVSSLFLIVLFYFNYLICAILKFYLLHSIVPFICLFQYIFFFRLFFCFLFSLSLCFTLTTSLCIVLSTVLALSRYLYLVDIYCHPFFLFQWN